MKTLWSILYIGVLLPGAINATEHNINNDRKQEIKVGSIIGILKSLPSADQTIGECPYLGEVSIGYSFQKVRLAWILDYYPDMLYGLPGPISVERHLKVWETEATIGYRVFSYKGFVFILHAGPILAWGNYWSRYIKKETHTFCSPKLGGLIGIEISKKLYKPLSICLNMSDKYYDLKDNDNRIFRVRGILFGIGLEYSFQKRR